MSGSRLRQGRALVVAVWRSCGHAGVVGDAGGCVSAELARVLELREPELPWHSQRDSLVEMVEVLAILTGSLAKLARDVALLDADRGWRGCGRRQRGTWRLVDDAA